MATTFALGAESNRLPACYILLFAWMLQTPNNTPAGVGISVASPQNSTILLANSEANVFRIPTSFPPKIVSSKANVTIVTHTDVEQAVDNRHLTQHMTLTNVSYYFSHCILSWTFCI